MAQPRLGDPARAQKKPLTCPLCKQRVLRQWNERAALWLIMPHRTEQGQCPATFQTRGAAERLAAVQPQGQE